MSNISFANPYLLLLAIPLVVLFAIPFFIAIRKENMNDHNIASLVIHVGLAILVGLSAAGTTIRTVLTETDVFVVADVSYSASSKLDEIDGIISGLELPQNSKLGVVTFGRNCELLTEMGGNVRSVKESKVDTSETDIAGALVYAGSLFKEDVIKRVVLITDGRPTDRTDPYALTRAVDELERKGVKVDAVYLDDNLTDGDNEVQLSGVKYTVSAFRGRSEQAVVTVRSTYETQAIIALTRDGEPAGTHVVTLDAGENTVTFNLYTEVTGTYNYKVTVTAGGDRSDRNNDYLFTQKVTGEMGVLIVTESWTDAKNTAARYPDGTLIDIYENDPSVSDAVMNTYIKRHYTGGNVTVTHDLRVPVSVGELCKYDEIVLAGTKLTDITAYSAFVSSLDTVVSRFGKSLITVGNPEIGSADQTQTALEDMLPVRFVNADNGDRLYTVVIDASRSMEQLSHLTVAKQLAVRMTDMLGDGDQICIIAFYSDAEVVQPPTRVNAGNRQEIIDRINGIQPLQGTVIHGGLEMAYKQIADFPYADKQLMLISDGKNFTVSAEEGDRSTEIAQNMREAGIVTSVFDVGRQGDDRDGDNTDPDNQRAKALLKSIAQSGGGAYHYSRNSESLTPDMFNGIVSDLNGKEVSQRSAVKVARRTDGVLDGVDVTAIPEVAKYVYSGEKPGAFTVLTVEYKLGTTVKDVPLYSYWEYGEGKVATFTGLEGGWLPDWEDDPTAQKLFTNMLTENVPAEKHVVPYSVASEWNETECTVTVTPPYYHYSAYATIKITSPDGTTLMREMTPADGTFKTSFTANGTGAYVAEIVYYEDGEPYITEETFCLSVMPEYDGFALFDPSELYRALNGRGTVSLDGKVNILGDDERTETYTIDLTVPLIIAAVVLFFIDVIVRKLKWEDILSLFGRGGGKSKGGERQ